MQSKDGKDGVWVGFEAARWAAQQMARTDITPASKLVLWAMASHAWSDAFEVWPSRKRLAAMTGTNIRTVTRAVDDLTAAGLIDVKSRMTACGDHDTNAYTLRIERGDKVSLPVEPSDHQGADKSPSPVVTGSHPETDLFGSTRSPSSSGVTGEMIEKLRQIWNTRKHPKQIAWTETSPDRATAARKRLRELPDLVKWERVVDEFRMARWLQGENGYKPASADFLLRPGTWAKALEGQLRDHQRPAARGTAAGRVEGAEDKYAGLENGHASTDTHY